MIEYMKVSVFVIFSIFIFAIGRCQTENGRNKLVYQKIKEEPDYSDFFSLLLTNSEARHVLLYSNATVFVPINYAFQKYDGYFNTKLISYHVSGETKSMNDLYAPSFLDPLTDSFPPIWISRRGDHVYVNNAKVIRSASDYVSTSVFEGTRHTQILHTIDEVLDPIHFNLHNPTAYDIIDSYSQVKTSAFRTLRFKQKLESNNQTKLFSQPARNTFFVPIDKGFDYNRFENLDQYVIRAHVISNQVMFTRSAVKNYYFESMSNGDYIFILVSFLEIKGKLYVRSKTALGDSNHRQGEILAEIVLPNIPVRNGVVHLISRPLAVFEKVLKPFPYLPVIYKIESDPTLNISYHLGYLTGLNNDLKTATQNVTYFVPRDMGWERLVYPNMSIDEDQRILLGKHIVISETPLLMADLADQSVFYKGKLELNTLSGQIEISVVKKEDTYYIFKNHKYIRVYRPDYICTNGVVHIIDEPFFEVHPKTHDSGFDFYMVLKDWLL